VKIFTGGPWCGNFAFCTGDLLFEDAYPPDLQKPDQKNIRQISESLWAWELASKGLQAWESVS
jgi:hypothetical protein